MLARVQKCADTNCQPFCPARRTLPEPGLAADTAIGRTKYDAAKKMVMIEDIVRFPAECVNPPADMKAEDWIKSGFKGAKC